MQRDDRTPPDPASSTFSFAAIRSALSSAATVSAPLLQSAASSVATATSSAASSVAASAVNYFTTTPVTAESNASSSSPGLSATADSLSKKQSRKTKDYLANVTAAIALPEIPPKPKQTTISWLSSAAAAAAAATTSLFTQPSKPTTTLATDNGPAISTLIKNLHARCLALFNDDMTDAQKRELDRCSSEKIDLLADQVKEHAARRVDLFFYCCVAVYKTNAVISDGQTIKQHGIGSREHGTQACHSALFSNLQLANPHVISSWPWTSLPSLMTLEGTHFMETSNMTVELPSEVNEFDKHLEGLYQRSAHVNHMLVILNRVSKGEINPQQAMTEFLRIIDFFFEDFKLKYLFDENNPCKPKPTKETDKIRSQLQTYQRIWELQREGSFKAAIQGSSIKEVDPYYVYSMLRINTFGQRYFHLLDTHFLSMQREIAESLSSNYAAPDPTDAFKCRLAQ